ncbi:hypothetical protein [Streptomyces cyaneochromogenes]|uniref:hypothetical protein n=1 Tax=Streptomyces cyaneochromogenes TaxID=2496836 RepID=UPI0015892138|nr:hypothetical protein [Streptomyces cyaneochromogenes]
MRISRARFLAMASAAVGTLLLPTTRAAAMIRIVHGERTPPCRGSSHGGSSTKAPWADR